MKSIPKIGIVGAGNVAQHLGKTFVDGGYSVDFIFSKTQKSAQELADKLGALVVDSIEKMSSCDFILCTASDSALLELIPQLSELAPVIVTSGTVDSIILATKFPVGVLYPLQTFSKNDTLDVSNIPFFIEASNSTFLSEIKHIAQQLSIRVVPIDAQQRKQLHVAAVFMNNFSNHLIALGQEHLKNHNLNPDWFKPLLNKTIQKLEILSAFDAQTGPAIRGDFQTIETHKALLSKEMANLYQLLSDSIQRKHGVKTTKKPQ